MLTSGQPKVVCHYRSISTGQLGRLSTVASPDTQVPNLDVLRGRSRLLVLALASRREETGISSVILGQVIVGLDRQMKGLIGN